MQKLMRKLAVLAALGLAAPAWAGDAKDTATEKKADVRKAARKAKPGHRTAGDRVADAKDTAKATGAKARKQGRKATAKTKRAAKSAEQKAKATEKDATR